MQKKLIITVIVIISLLGIIKEDLRSAVSSVAFESNSATLDCNALFAKFSPDDKSVITTWRTPPTSPSQMRLWDIQSGKGKLLQIFDGESNSFIGSPYFSPDGTLILVGYNSKAILWDTQTGEQVHVFERDQRNPNDITDAFFSADGLYIVTAGREGANIWETKSGKKLLHILPNRLLLKTQLSSDGNFLLLIEVDGGATLWSVKNNRKLYTFDNAADAMFSPNGKWIITKGSDGLNLWEVSNPKIIKNFDTQIGWSVFEISFDSKYLFALDRLWEHLYIWNIETGSQIKSFEGKNIEGRFFPDRDSMLLSYVKDDVDTANLQIWDIEPQSVTKRMTIPTELENIHDISKDGKLILGLFNSNVQLRTLETGEKLFEFC